MSNSFGFSANWSVNLFLKSAPEQVYLMFDRFSFLSFGWMYIWILFFLFQGNWMKQKITHWAEMTSSFTRFLTKTLQAQTPIKAAKEGIWNVTSVIQPFPDIGSFQCHGSSDGGSRWNLLIARFFPVFATISWSITMISKSPLSYQPRRQHQFFSHYKEKSIFVYL